MPTQKAQSCGTVAKHLSLELAWGASAEGAGEEGVGLGVALLLEARLALLVQSIRLVRHVCVA